MGFADPHYQGRWREFLTTPEVEKELDSIFEVVRKGNYYPRCEDVLHFMRNDVSKIKHVLVGMDPYPSWNEEGNCPQATGRSFEVSELRGKSWDFKFRQSSLRNILKAVHLNETGREASVNEIREEIASGKFAMPSPTSWFDAMEEQGVIFLNATLTVEAGKPNSHKQLWKTFRRLLAGYVCDMSPDAKWHLWGKDAQETYGLLIPEPVQLRCCHPRLAAFISENTLRQAQDVSWTGMRNV